MPDRDILIIGGGVSGLACAQRLSRAGYKVTVLEEDTVLGGLAKSFLHSNNRWIPIAYHHVLTPDKITQSMIAQFNLSDKMRWINSSQVFWYNDKFYPLSKPYHILTFRPLGLSSKIRLLLFGGYVWFKKDWRDKAKYNCEEWLRKNLGDEITEVLFKNLMEIKFNMSLATISMAWLGQRLNQSVRNYDRYGYITTGLNTLFDRMRQDIINNAGVIKTGMRVVKIDRNDISAQDTGGKTQTFKAGRIVSSIPPPALSALLGETHGLEFLNTIQYKSIISFICGSKDELSSYYWSVVLEPLLKFGGFFNHTLLNPGDASAGEKIYNFFTYLDSDDPFFTKTDNELTDIYLRDARKLFPDFDISWGRIFKIKYSAPVYLSNYANPPIELKENFYLTGVYRKYPRPRTMDAAFESGIETAEYIKSKDYR